MTRLPYISGSVSVPHFIFSGGLNSTAGALSLQDNEASDLQNVDFDVFGSVKKRNGYKCLNETVLATGTTGNGMYWYSTPNVKQPVLVAGGKIYKMDELDGVWDDVTGGVSLGAADSSTKLLLHCNGADMSTAFVDAVGKTVTNSLAYVLKDSRDIAVDNRVDISVTDPSTQEIQKLSYPLVAGSDYYLGKIEADLRKVNSPTGTVWLELYNNNAGNPGTILATSTTKTAASLSATDNYEAFTFNTLVSLTSGTTYWITLNDDRAIDDTNLVEWAGNVDILATKAHYYLSIAGWTYWNDVNLNYKTYEASVVTHSTSINKFGAASGYLDGDTASLSLADHADWSFGAGNFTIDFWTRFAQINTSQVFCGQYADANNYWFTKIDNTNKLQMKFVSVATTMGDYIMASAWAGLTTNTWYHIAAVRSSGVGLIFVNGTSQAVTETTAFSTNNVGDVAATLTIGQQNSLLFYKGYLDEFRISKGTARWVANFTPPVKEYGEYLQNDFETFGGYVLGTDGENIPWQWLATNSTASTMVVPTGLLGAKFVKKFQNYCFLANVKVSDVKYPSRFYWSSIKDLTTWASANYIDVSPDDGEEITGFKVLGDRLVCYKTQSVYLIFFTGDADIPFIVQKANSSVGCIAPYSIQEVSNGHVFLAYDGLYYFDGNNSYKMSDRLNKTLKNCQTSRFPDAISMYQKLKNRYWLAISSASTTFNDKVITWDSLNNGFSIYDNMYPSSMAIFLVNGVDERPYFFDYKGYAYWADNTSANNDDYPANSKTAIDAYYYTGWKKYEDICSTKSVPHTYIYHQNNNATLTFAYSYDYSTVDDFSNTFSTYSTGNKSGLITRQDLDGRGHLVRFKFANARTSETFQIDGIGAMVKLETDT